MLKLIDHLSVKFHWFCWKSSVSKRVLHYSMSARCSIISTHVSSPIRIVCQDMGRFDQWVGHYLIYFILFVVFSILLAHSLYCQKLSRSLSRFIFILAKLAVSLAFFKFPWKYGVTIKPIDKRKCSSLLVLEKSCNQTWYLPNRSKFNQTL